MISFACAQCGMKYRVKDEYAGRPTKCATCKNRIVVPNPAREATVVSGNVAGMRSTISQADIPGDGVTLDCPADVRANGPSVRDVLGREQKPTTRYQIASEIARGGMSAVLRAVDCDLRREVALKYLLDSTNSAKNVRFVEEAQITGQLEHPNIVPIHELGLDAEHRLFFSMKMVKGRSLAELLKDNTVYLGRLLTVLVNVCNALSYAHSRRVVHRDLKPANIMIGDFGEVYVMDWGLAKVLDDAAQPSTPTTFAPPRPSKVARTPVLASTEVGSDRVNTSREQDADLTQDGTILGTPMYMPPEQATGRINDIDERSDIYSLGAILYEILTLLPPIDREGGHMAVLMRVAEGEIVTPEMRVRRARNGRSIPAELSAVAMKALSKERQDRYASVAELREDIERFMEGRAVSVKQDTTWETIKKLIKRNKGASAAAAVACVVLMVVVYLFLQANRTARLRAEDARAESDAAFINLRKEQLARTTEARKAAPAMVRAARLFVNERNFDDAMAQVDEALRNAEDNAEARLLKAHLLIGKNEFPAAVEELKEYLKLEPKDDDAKKLLELCRTGVSGDAKRTDALAEILNRQKMYAIVEQLAVTDKRQVDTFQKRLNDAWGDKGSKIAARPNGTLSLVISKKTVSDLSPLKGIPFTDLSVTGHLQLRDLEPLRGMPLTSLNLSGCTLVRNLQPLQGMKLVRLDLDGTQVESLTVLQGMPLEELHFRNCKQIRDFTPLRRLPLTRLDLYGTGISELTPLEGAKLSWLDISACPGLEDLKPLTGMPLQELRCTGGVRVASLEPLRKSKLEILNLTGCLRLEDLSPLSQLPLRDLVLNNCQNLRDLRPLSGMKLKSLDIAACPKIVDLTPLEGMQLESIAFDLKPVGTSVEALRKIETLSQVTVRLVGKTVKCSAEEFWHRHDAGEFGN